MKRDYLIAMTAVLTLFTASPVLAEVISNGGFETFSEGKFNDWNFVSGSDPAAIQQSTNSVIAGASSAKIGCTNTGIGQISQSIVFDNSRFQFDLDFAVLSGSGRTLGVQLYQNSGPGFINLKLDTGTLYAVSYVGGDHFESTGISLSAEDYTSGSSWTGQTPVTNHLTIKGYFDAATPYYTITLNDSISSDLTYYHVSAVPQGAKINVVGLRGGNTADAVNYLLADNVTVGLIGVPEPSSIALLSIGVMGLLAYAWRKRK